MQYDVSFVATFYNKEKFIPLVLASIFEQQGLDDVEYIFVDDGSTDNSLALLKLHTQGRHNVQIVSQKNSGPAIATNAGINLAQKTFIKFIDGDDLLHPQVTRLLIDEMLKHKACSAYAWDPDVTWYDGEAKNDWPTLRNAFKVFPPHVESEPKSLPAFLKGHVCNPSMFISYTNTIKKAGGCDNSLFIQDYALALRAAQQGPCIWVKVNGVQFPSVTADRLSQNRDQTVYDMNMALAHFIEDYKHTLSPYLVRYSTRHACRRASKLLRHHKFFVQSAGAFVLSLLAFVPAISHPGFIEKSTRPLLKTGKIRRIAS